MEKNQEIIIEITDITSEGSGVGKYDGIVVFVPLTAVNDTVKVKILKVKKTYAYGKLIEIINPSPYRVENDCPHFSKCGGCVYRHISYAQELKLKSNRVYENIKRIGNIDLKPKEILYDDNINNYRNKAQYPIDSQGKTGFFAFHSHRIISCDICFLQPAIFSQITKVFEEWIKENSVSVYNELQHKGLLRHLYIRIGEKTQEIMVCVVINGEELPFKDRLIALLKDLCKDNLKSFLININKKDTNVILGDKCVTLYGQDYITDILCGVRVRLSALSFYQVNRNMAEKLYLKAMEYAKPQGSNILDLYCGAGTIGLSMAKKAKNIIGVEIVPEAVKDAQFNAKNNNIENARFICSDATEAATKISTEGIDIDTVIVDPPRKGCSEDLINTISKKFKPERVVYVSCDPATLARDIGVFSLQGYKLLEYTPADLFPRTSHVETVCLLSKVQK